MSSRGTSTGGSVRDKREAISFKLKVSQVEAPSSQNNIVGMRPTMGIVSQAGGESAQSNRERQY